MVSSLRIWVQQHDSTVASIPQTVHTLREDDDKAERKYSGLFVYYFIMRVSYSGYITENIERYQILAPKGYISERSKADWRIITLFYLQHQTVREKLQY